MEKVKTKDYKRVFIGVPVWPTTSFRHDCQRLREQLSHHRISWTRESNMHVTLWFIGNISRNDFALLLKDFRQTEWHLQLHLRLRTESLGVFRSRKSAKIIYARVKDMGLWTQLLNEVLLSLKMGETYDSKTPFVPHLTLGRIRRPIPETELDALIGNWESGLVLNQQSVQLCVYESVPGPDGPVYKVWLRKEIH